MSRRRGWNIALVWFGLFLGCAVLWLVCIGGGWVVFK